MRKYMVRTITKYHIKIVDMESDEILDEYTVNRKITKQEVMKSFLKDKGYAPVRIEIEKEKTKRRMLVEKFIELSEKVEEY